MRRFAALIALLACLGFGLAVAGCGSSSKSNDTTNATNPTADTVPPPAPTGSSVTQGSGVEPPTTSTGSGG